MPGPSDRERQKREKWLRDQEKKRMEERRKEEERIPKASGVSWVEWIVVAVVLGLMAVAALMLFTNAGSTFIN